MTTDPSLAGRVALITGGGSGIGRACCLVLARDGAKVVITDVNLKSAKDTLALMPDPENHVALSVDVRERASVEKVFSEAQDQCGEPPSLLVNCAGVAKPCPFLEVEEDSLVNFFDVNLKGTFLASQVFAKALLEGKKEASGAIVNIASITGKTGSALRSHYAATKGGVIALTKSCGAELASHGIRVNCILPGVISTPMLLSLDSAAMQYYKSVIPLARLGKPEEVAEVVSFLLGDRSSYMVGACLEVTGGCCM